MVLSEISFVLPLAAETFCFLLHRYLPAFSGTRWQCKTTSSDGQLSFHSDYEGHERAGFLFYFILPGVLFLLMLRESLMTQPGLWGSSLKQFDPRLHNG